MLDSDAVLRMFDATDASDWGLRALLQQIHEEDVRTFTARTLPPVERTFAISHCTCLSFPVRVLVADHSATEQLLQYMVKYRKGLENHVLSLLPVLSPQDETSREEAFIV